MTAVPREVPWDRAVLVPVRHHSPACARLVAALIDRLHPAAVAIELPADLQPLADSLATAALVPPVALYAQSQVHGTGRGAFYPFAAFTPEWVALREAARRDIPVHFIDLAYGARVAVDHSPAVDPNPDLLPVWDEHGLEGSAGVAALLAASGRSDFDAAWDALVEAEPFAAADPWPLLRRLQQLAGLLRDVPVLGGDAATVAREDAMAAGLRQLLASADAPVLAVTGAFHTEAIAARLRDAAWQPPSPRSMSPATATQGYLVAWDHARLERASDYRAGLTGTGWHARSWAADATDLPAATAEALSQRFLVELAREARRLRLPQAPGLPVAIEAALAARRLALLRGSPTPTRSDTAEAAALSFIPGARDPDGAAILALLDTAMAGSGRGSVPAGLGRPPLVDDVRRRAVALGLNLDEPRPPRLRLDPLKHVRAQRLVRFLNRLALLDAGFALRLKGPDLVNATGLSRRTEEWQWAWTAEVEVRLIECAMLGPDLPAAAAGLVLQRAAAIPTGAGALEPLSALLVQAVLCGLAPRIAPLAAQLAAAAPHEPDPTALALALARMEAVLVTAQATGLRDIAPLAALVVPLYAAACARLPEASGNDDAALQRFADCLRLLRRLAAGPQELLALGVPRLDPAPAIAACAVALHRRPPAPPAFLGGFMALRFALGGMSAAELGAGLAALLGGTLPAAARCSAVTGAMAVDRTAMWQFPPVTAALDGAVRAMPEDDFLEALPELRLAFAGLTPAEIARLAAALRQPGLAAAVAADTHRRALAPADLARGRAVEAELTGLLARDGLGAWMAAASHAAGDAAPAASEIATGAHPPDAEALRRWRLILGRYADAALNLPRSLSDADMARERVLDTLYRREHAGRGAIDLDDDDGGEDRGDSPGKPLSGSGAPDPRAIDWLDAAHTAFPTAAVEVLQRHALDRYGLTDILADPRALENISPSVALATLLLRLKSAVEPAVLPTVRAIVGRVVADLTQRLTRIVRRHGPRRRLRRQRGTLRSAQDFDLRGTLRDNLRGWQPQRRALVLRRLHFFARQSRGLPMTVILCVDQSGSMMGSMLHAAVLAGVLAGLPGVKVKLVVFSTEVTDLSHAVSDPVALLLSVFMGGGTDIGRACRYCEGLATAPARTVFVLISDFAEGGDPAGMLAAIARMNAAGVTQLGLPALEDGKQAFAYDRIAAARAAGCGMHVAAMTPDGAAAWLAERLA